MSLLPNHRTDITALATTQAEELKYGSIRHSVALTGNWVVDGSVGITKAQPGYTLEVQEILSLSRSLGMGATYQWWRDRDDSLSTRIGLDTREVSSKLLGSQLSEDNIRTIRASASYTGSDGAEGSSSLNATLTRGLSMFGASNAGDVNLTRAEAEPDFTKIELSASRYQRLPADLMLVGAISAQLASGPLYASEEFGYGGQNFGRAYDNSEITGDHGAAASVELRYLGLPVTYDMQIVPYAFYDIGKVWNEDTGQDKPIDASSAGAAVRVAHQSGVSSNLGVAFPLTRPIATPITGRDQGPRIMMQAGIAF
jgi:hemolysin activation/secretion protein